MFLDSVHVFRALTIVFIVAGHCIGAFRWRESPDLVILLRILLCNGSVMFVFISGYLFQHLSNQYHLQRYVVSKFRHVVLPYVIVSIPAILVFTLHQERVVTWKGLYESPVWVQWVYFLGTGRHLAPMWFIPMICCIYLVSPLLLRADRIRGFYWALPVFIIITCLVSRGGVIHNTLHMLSAYVLGMACSRYKERINSWLIRLRNQGLLLALIAALGYIEYSLELKGVPSPLNTLHKMLLSLAVLGFLTSLGSSVRGTLIDRLAEDSFWIFCLHSYVITSGKIIMRKVFGGLRQGDVLTLALVTVVVLLVCMILIAGVRTLAVEFQKIKWTGGAGTERT